MVEQLNASFEKLLTKKRSPGIGAIIIDRSGNRLYEKCFGRILVDDENSAPFTLMERGLVDLDDPVSKYLPSEPPLVIAGFDEDGKPITRPAKTEIKVIYLATHTSGYTYYLWDELIYKYRTSKNQSIGNCLPVAAKHQFEDNILVTDPGTRYCYSFSVDKLGQVIESITGQILPDYIRENITDPLGMTRTGTHPITEDYLRCHYKTGDGKVVVTPIIPDPKPYRYVLLNDSVHPHIKISILSPSTVLKYVFTDQLPILGVSATGPTPVGIFPQSLYDLGSVNAGELLPGPRKGWEIGLMLNLDDVQGRRRGMSGAWAGLANMYFWVDWRSGIAGVVGTSFLPFMDGEVLRVAEEVERWVYKEVGGIV